MTASALQEFLRSLGGSLGAVGVPAKSLADIHAVADALKPFKDLSLEQLADFLARAAAFRSSGEVSAVSVAGLDDTTGAARSLSESVQSFGAANGAAAEESVAQGKQALQTALGKLAGEFGLGVKFTDDKKWLADLRSKGEVSRVVETFGRLVPQIADATAYQSDAVQSAVDSLAATDAKVLKAAAGVLGAEGKGKGKAYVESLLAKLTGIGVKSTAGSKKAEPTATDEQVAAIGTTLESMVERARDPDAVSDAEIDDILAQLAAGFSTAQQKAIAKRVTGKSGNSAQAAVGNLRLKLTAVKRLRETQRV